MQQQSLVSWRRGAAMTLAVLSLSACRPYGPPIPGSGAPYPVDPSSGPRAGTYETAPVMAPVVAPAIAAAAASEPAVGAADSATTSAASGTPVRDASVAAARSGSDSPLAVPMRFRSRQDSVAWADARRRAKIDKGLRVVVSLDARTLWLLHGVDTLRLASVAIGTEKRLVHGKQEWVFETPRGMRTVKGKAADPIWTPPMWHYVEMAERHGLKLAVMPPTGRVSLARGERLEVRDSLVGRWTPGRGWRALPVEDEIVVDGTLYMPPIGTKNRIQHGQLGPFKLDVGQGYLIHGTPDASSIGRAATHGCIRLGDDDLAFLYDLVPVGTPVYIL